MDQTDSSRRMFLKAPAVAAGAASALMQWSCAQKKKLSVVSSPDAIRVGIVGLGNRGGFLLHRIRTNPAVRVVALCDLMPERIAAAAKDAASVGWSPASYSDYRALLRHDGLEAVIIATPVHLHRDMSIAALEAGKHLYCEKPMALDEKGCKEVASAAAAARCLFQSGFQFRHDPYCAASMRYIKSGALGKVLFLEGHRHSPDPWRQIGWLYDRSKSGDLIVEQGCHIIDLMVWAAGTHPIRAFGSGGINMYRNDPPHRTALDNYSVIYEFPDDVRFCFNHILFDPLRFSGIKQRVFGSKAAIDLTTATVQEHGKKKQEKLKVPDPQADASDLSLANFIENIRTKQKPLNCAESSRVSTLTAIMGRRSIYERRIVTWDEVSI